MRGQKTALQTLRPLILVLIVLGVAVLSYPTVASCYNTYRQNQVIATYREAAEGTVDYAQERTAAAAYNRRLLSAGQAIVTADTMDVTDDAEYEALLDISGTGAMGYLSIPKIALELPVYHYYTEDNTTGLGHLYGSSLPIGGAGTHAVLAAHRGLPSAKLFTNLDQLEVGDRFYLHVLGETLAYEVDEIVTVLPTEVDRLRIDPEADYVTLMTCTPYAVNTHRLLVRGVRIEYDGESTDGGSALRALGYQIDRYQWMAAGVLLLLLLLLAIVGRGERRRRRKSETSAKKRKEREPEEGKNEERKESEE